MYVILLWLFVIANYMEEPLENTLSQSVTEVLWMEQATFISVRMFCKGQEQT